jgi:hypothetical protein
MVPMPELFEHNDSNCVQEAGGLGPWHAGEGSQKDTLEFGRGCGVNPRGQFAGLAQGDWLMHVFWSADGIPPATVKGCGSGVPFRHAVYWPLLFVTGLIPTKQRTSLVGSLGLPPGQDDWHPPGPGIVYIGQQM